MHQDGWRIGFRRNGSSGHGSILASRPGLNFHHGLLGLLFLPSQKSLNVFCALSLIFHQTCM
jgi:hypothetical protein